GADKVRFYAPEIRFLPDVATLSEVVLRDRPEYVVTFCPETYRRQAAALGHNPLAGYHVVYQKVCHLEEGEVANDGFVWRRGPDTMRARATRRKGGRTTASLSQ
ncbi:MAG TPA: hypothetical protein VG013_02970, partial [Gemmataceae bacterium]|nr:hypothetical protein [Gemmataceae bacterium]